MTDRARDAALLKKYPLPPELAELADTLAHGHPRPRTPAAGIADMQAILKKLRADRGATVEAMDLPKNGNEDLQRSLLRDLDAIDREIRQYTLRLAEYELMAKHIN